MTISGVKIKKADGTWDGGSAPAPDVQDFTTSGTWTKPAGAKWVFVEAISGGTGASGYTGGVGGNYSPGVFPADSLGATETVTIGAGGIGASSGVGGPGGTTSIGSLLSVACGAPLPTGGLDSERSLDRFADGGLGSQAKNAGGSQLGAGGGSGGRSGTGPIYSPGLGGQLATALGLLKAGDGGAGSTTANSGNGSNGGAPGGGGGGRGGGGGTPGNGAPGAVRITTYF